MALPGVLMCSIAHGAVQPNQVYQLSTDKTQLVYTVGEDGRLIFRYYGPRLSDANQFARWRSYNRPDCDREANYEAYPSFGLGYVNEPALSVVNADGSLITELGFENYEQHLSEGVVHGVFTLLDRISSMMVQLHVYAYQ